MAGGAAVAAEAPGQQNSSSNSGQTMASAAAGAAATPQAAASSQLLLSMNDFANFKQIGKGKDCVVYAASCGKLGGHSVVLKVYQREKISAIKQRSIRREARIMRYLTDKRIPHTTAYTGAFQDSKQIYIVMEHCKGGDLLEQLLKEGRAMPEKRVVREVVLPTLTALAHLHAAGIIHRDIKLENLFISSRGHLQLGDFGLAISVLEERAISPVGTLEYMSPEILRLPSTDLVLKGAVKVEDICPIDEKVDVWSFGVTVYELVTGRSPFEGSNKDEIKTAILGFQMRALPGFLTPGCQDFILKCLCPKAGDRPSALALLSHPWVQLHCTPADLVTIARLPLQLPKVPMGYKPSSSSAAAAVAGRQQQQQAGAAGVGGAGGGVQRQVAAPGSGGSSAAVSAVPSPAMTPRELNTASAAAMAAAAATAATTTVAAVSAGGKPSAPFAAPETKIHGNSSTTSSPDSPQIPAFMPSPGGPNSPAGMAAAAAAGGGVVGCSSASVASTACSSHVAGGGRSSSCSRSSNSSNSSSVMHAACAGGSMGGRDHSTFSTDSVRSSNLSSVPNDSAASLYQHSLAAAAAGSAGGAMGSSGGGSATSSCYSIGQQQQAGMGMGSVWAQEPIQESPTDESAAAAATSFTGRKSDNASLHGAAGRQQQAYVQQHQHMMLLQQPPAANSLQQLQQSLEQSALMGSQQVSMGPAAAAAVGAAMGSGSAQKHAKKSGGKRLWKWVCVAAGAASPNASS